MTDASATPDFSLRLPQGPALEALIDSWLSEDIGRGDITTDALVPAAADAVFEIRPRHPLVVCGMPVAEAIFRRQAPEATIEVLLPDGSRCRHPDVIATVAGPARPLLRTERTALNLLQTLTGIATLTAQYAALVEGSGATLVDTRKTIPGLRALSKYATSIGGARNHRLRLDDGVLIKDNHIAVHGSVAGVLAAARRVTPSLTKIEIECDTLEQVAEAAEAGADVILLDNMDAETLRQAVGIVAGRAETEASGGVTLETVAEKARTGVDYISVGRITQSAPAADIGLDARISG